MQAIPHGSFLVAKPLSLTTACSFSSSRSRFSVGIELDARQGEAVLRVPTPRKFGTRPVAGVRWGLFALS